MSSLGSITPQDEFINEVLRPRTLSDFIGQSRLKDQVHLIIEAAGKRGEAFDHLLFYGPPGLGKTTLAHIIARESKKSLRSTAGPAIEKAGDLAALLTNVESGDIIFIDEIHRLPRTLEEILYLALEDRILNIMVGKGPGARSVQLKLPEFTLVGATTRIGLISGPLRSRFGGTFQIDFYQDDDISRIIKRSAKLLNVNIDDEAVSMIARASRATPRVANRLLKRVRDFVDLQNENTIDADATLQTLKILEVDELGLERNDIKLLNALWNTFRGKPAGLNALAALLGEEDDNIEEVYEPFLMRLGFIERTPKGRIITQKGIDYLKAQVL